MTVLRLFRSLPRSADTDAELLARFVASRDETAFAELLRRHGPLVYRVCRRLLDASLTDDAFQATFLVLATRANQVKKAASVGSWLIGVAGRVARQMRRRTVRVALVGSAATQRGADEEAANRLEIADLGRVLDEELTRLPDQLRSVVVACLIEDRTQVDAAKTLGESERTIRRRVAEARQLLRERLERRGVVPAVAGGLIAGLGTAAAVPSRLADSTLSVVFDFLAGDAAVASVPAVLAKGVAMSGVRKTLAASLAVVAIGFSMLGLGFAGEEPKAKAEAKTIPPQNVPLTGKEPAQPPRPAVQGPPLFVVTGGDELVNRVVQREAEFAANILARRWTGKPLPPLADKWRIVVKLDLNATTGSTTFTYSSDKPARVISAEMKLTGSLEQILRIQLPHELTHCALAAHFGRQLPRWADEGIALLSEPAKDQADLDIKCRDLLNGGRGLTLKHLLPMIEYPKDLPVLYAQGHSVARFLHARDPKKLLPLIEASFTDGWDKALKATYGFTDADELEKAWIDWLRQPENVLKVEAKPAGVKADYKFEPPDILRIRFKPKVDDKYLIPADAEYMVRPDGTISLGAYGTVAVTGMTPAEATDAVRKVLKKSHVEAVVTVDVIAFNSKVYYVVKERPGGGEEVVRLPCMGNETVLDAVAVVGDLKADAKVKVWVARPVPKGGGKGQILPVDWKGITQNGDTKTNYQLQPGDRVYVMPK